MDNKEIEKLIENLDNIVPNITPHSSDEEKQKVLEHINYVLGLAPQNTNVLSWKAIYYMTIEDYDNTILTCKEILKIDPNDLMAKETIEDCEKLKELQTEIQSSSRSYCSHSESDLLEKVPVSFLVTAKIIILAAVIWFCCPALILSFNDNKILNIKDPSRFQTIKVNPLSEYDNLTKQQIFDIRKEHVKNSLFAKENYEPDNSVFGSIVDNKPWWGTITCNQLDYKGDYHERIEGPSKVSAQMNNPNALVGLSLPFIPWEYDYNQEFCTSDYGRFLPVSIQYDKKDNLIVSKYKLTKRFLKYRSSVNGKMTRYPIQLSGLNARDFGYDYVYIYDSKNITMFEQNNNITEGIRNFTDYIHLGGSCKYKDGCNNISPMQYDKIFTVYKLPAEINMKLWKKRPANQYMKADMYYRIILDE